MDDFNKFSKGLIKYYRNNDFKSLRCDLEEFLNEHWLNFDEGIEYYYFDSFTDEIIFDTLFKTNDNVKIIENNHPLIFSMYGSVLMNFNEYSKAKAYFKLANKINPLNIRYIIDMAKIYDVEGNGKAVKSSLDYALSVVHDEFDLFDIYEYYAMYFKQIGELDFSKILFSLKNKKSLNNYDSDYLINQFDKYNVSLGFETRILNVVQYASSLVSYDFDKSYDLYYDYLDLYEFNQLIFE